MPSITLAGKPIAITGASSGIGRAAALACARAGMPVALAARREDRLASVLKEITDSGGRAIAVTTDVERPDDCQRLIDRTVEAFGSIYALFANAGYGLTAPIHQTTDEQMRRIFETNFFGTLNAVRPALASMLAPRDEPQARATPTPRGHILICSSAMSKMAIPRYGAYAATKAAQDHIARAMRLELAPCGVHVSSIHPIGTRTEFSASLRRPGVEGEETRVERANTPTRFIQSPERVADAIVRCLQRPRPEVWTSTITRLAFAALGGFPRAADYALRRFASARD